MTIKYLTPTKRIVCSKSYSVGLKYSMQRKRKFLFWNYWKEVAFTYHCSQETAGLGNYDGLVEYLHWHERDNNKDQKPFFDYKERYAK